MNIYENVEKRAAHALAHLVRVFSFPLSKIDPLTYRTQETTPTIGWEIRYTRAKKWLSRVYKAEITYIFERQDNGDFHLSWSPAKQEWTSLGEGGSRLVGILNTHKEIANQLASVDMEKVELTQRGDLVTISLIPIPGCFIWTLIPPMHYYVRLKPHEAVALTSIAGRLESTIIEAGE